MINLTPFNIRINDIELRSYKQIKVKGQKPHKTNIGFEIVKWETNLYYGKENDYRPPNEEYPDSYRSKTSDLIFISTSCFKNPQSCYVIYFFEDLDDDDHICLRSVGDRPYTLNKEDRKILNKIIKIGFKQLIKQLNNIEHD
jgi:hypothetical protein